MLVVFTQRTAKVKPTNENVEALAELALSRQTKKDKRQPTKAKFSKYLGELLAMNVGTFLDEEWKSLTSDSGGKVTIHEHNTTNTYGDNCTVTNNQQYFSGSAREIDSLPPNPFRNMTREEAIAYTIANPFFIYDHITEVHSRSLPTEDGSCNGGSNTAAGAAPASNPGGSNTFGVSSVPGTELFGSGRGPFQPRPSTGGP